MRVSIELFLLDNILMNYLVLKLAAVLHGKRLRAGKSLAFCAFGAVYALLSLGPWQFLQHPLLKLLLGIVMAIPIKRSWKRFHAAVVYLYIAAFFTGGLMFALSMALGGSVRAGAVLGTVPLRVFLLGAAAACAAPRLARKMMATVRARTRRARMLMCFSDRTLELTALLDSGNLLTEPLSGLPVIVVRKGLLPQGLRPVPYKTVDGEGFLYAVRPTTVQVYQDGWFEIDAYAAEAPNAIDGADAIIDAQLITMGGLCDGKEQPDQNTDGLVQTAFEEARKGRVLHPFGRDAARAVPGGGGTDLDCETDGEGRESQECAD